MKKNPHKVAIIGGGPAGLMAAEALSQAGVVVDLYDAMPSTGRKFLMAGKGGMNITHSEPLDRFISRYGARSGHVGSWLADFGPDALCEWAHGLGISTFVGSSGRVFPTDMKAAPLLRAWLHRLREAGVHFHMRHRWRGWIGPESDNTTLRFETSEGEVIVNADAVVLAMGGGSWKQLGSDGTWVPLLAARGISIAPLKPANCGFDAQWSSHFREKYAGHPLKSVTLSFTDASGNRHCKQGDLMVTTSGVEGGLIYALSALLRDEIEAAGSVVVHIDLLPGKDLARVIAEVDHPRGSRSMSGHLQSRANIKGVKVGLLRELIPRSYFDQPGQLAAAIKSLPLVLVAPRPLNEAISSAGGVVFEELDERLMALPGVFCAGEMLDWEAPTGGYLLTACFASGRRAGQGAIDWLAAQRGH
jgi:uncharacterized flavoprotein (TIGR03862 family)